MPNGRAHDIGKHQHGEQGGDRTLQRGATTLDGYGPQPDVDHQADELGGQPGMLMWPEAQQHHQPDPEGQQSSINQVRKDTCPLFLQVR